jgi:hypothetical protein
VALIPALACFVGALVDRELSRKRALGKLARAISDVTI